MKNKALIEVIGIATMSILLTKNINQKNPSYIFSEEHIIKEKDITSQDSVKKVNEDYQKRIYEINNEISVLKQSQEFLYKRLNDRTIPQPLKKRYNEKFDGFKYEINSLKHEKDSLINLL